MKSLKIVYLSILLLALIITACGTAATSNDVVLPVINTDQPTVQSTATAIILTAVPYEIPTVIAIPQMTATKAASSNSYPVRAVQVVGNEILWESCGGANITTIGIPLTGREAATCYLLPTGEFADLKIDGEFVWDIGQGLGKLAIYKNNGFYDSLYFVCLGDYNFIDCRDTINETEKYQIKATYTQALATPLPDKNGPHENPWTLTVNKMLWSINVIDSETNEFQCKIENGESYNWMPYTGNWYQIIANDGLCGGVAFIWPAP